MNRCVLVLGLLIALSLPSWPLWAQPKKVSLGIAMDGPGTAAEVFPKIFMEEIKAVLGSEFTVDSTVIKRGAHSASSAKATIDALLNDPKVDIVLALGPIVSQDAARRTKLSKPVLAPFILDPTLQGVPLVKGKSGRTNLSYTTTPFDIFEGLRVFQRVMPDRKKIGVLVPKGFLEALPDVDKAFIAMLKADNINAVVVPITNDPIASLDAMPDDVDAVYLVSMYHLTADLEQTLLDAIHDRQLPTFAHIGRPGVERGILLGSAPSEALPKIARRTAINVERILLGDKPSSFNVTLVPGPYRLVINLETAHKIGYSPSFSLLAEAEAIGTAVKELPEMTLQQALDKAVASNLELLAAVQDIEANTERVGEARGALLPQLSASVRGTLIDEDRAEAGFGQAPEVAAFVEGEFSQIIYADGLWAQYIGSGYTLDAAKAAQNQLQQDVVEATALAYLNVLRAQTLLRVNTDNLDITRTNLEMAQVRVQIGTATASDVYRWEIELAQDKGEVINARNALSQARIQVNRLLNRNQEFEFTALDVAPGDPILLGSGGSIRRYVNNERDMAIFRNFMVEEGLRTSPELKQLDASILAQERVVLSLRRRLYVPQVALVGDLSLRVLEGGAGTEAAALPEQFGGVSLGGDQDDLNWSLSVVAELPLFAGGTNYAARDAARADLSRLQIDRDNLAIQIEQNVRTRIYDASSTGANIDLSAQAAEASRKNLELTSRAYSQGAITVITLLDAQNTAFVSEQASANAVYDFLIDVVEVERSIGRFQYFGTVAERQAWLQRLDDYFTKAREENRP